MRSSAVFCQVKGPARGVVWPQGTYFRKVTR
jgi:hypothetical protein